MKQIMLEKTATAAGFVSVNWSIQIVHFISRKFMFYLVNYINMPSAEWIKLNHDRYKHVHGCVQLYCM